MLKPSYTRGILLTAIFVGLFFQINTFAQTARQRAEAFKNEGDKEYQKRNYDTAVTYYVKAIEADKNFPDTYWSLGFALSNLHKHKLAVDSFIIYLDAVKNEDNIYFVNVLYAIGNQHRLLKDFTRSAEAFDLALRMPPKSTVDLQAASAIYSYRGNLAQAAAYMQRAIDYSNSDTDEDAGRYISLSWYYSFLQRHQDSVNAATKAIRIDSGSAMAYTNRCRAYNDLKQYPKAISDCTTALDLEPNHGETQYYLANAYRGQGKTKLAAEYNKLAIPNLAKEVKAANDRDDISIADYCYLLGNALYVEKNYKDAALFYEAGLEFRGNFPFLRYNLGMAYVQLKDKQNAMIQYEELLLVDKVKAASLKGFVNQLNVRKPNKPLKKKR